MQKIKEAKARPFTLHRCKRLPNGGMEVKYYLVDVDGNTMYEDSMTKKSPKVQHPDLDKAFDRVKYAVLHVMGVSTINTIIDKNPKEKEKKAFGEVSPTIGAWVTAQENRIVINGFIFKGEGEKKSVKILASLFNDNKKTIPFNSPSFELSKNTFGFEANLADDVEEIMEEVQAYILDGKKAQPEIFDKQQEVIATGKSPKKAKAEKEPKEPIVIPAASDTRAQAVVN